MTRILAILTLVLCTAAAHAQVAVVGSITTVNTSGTLISTSYTVPATTTVLRLDETNVGFSGNGVAPSGCTYNGVAMTKAVGITDTGPTTETSIWYIVSPPTGASHTLACTYPSSTNEIVIAPVPLSGVSTSAPIGTGASVAGLYSSPTQPAVTASGGSTNDLYACVATVSTVAVAASGSQTSIWNQSTAGYGSGGGTIPGSSSGACTWTYSGGGQNWTAVAIVFKASGGGSSSNSTMFLSE